MRADRRFRALAETIVPDAARLDEEGWGELARIVDQALADRPASLRRQLALLIGVLTFLPLLRYGRWFPALPSERRARFLSAVQDAPLLLLRRGFWGLRTLVFMGYYARPEAAAEIGYHADVRGWEARA
jgi:hypothetical protein